MAGIDWQQILTATVQESRLAQLVLSRPLTKSDVTKFTVHPVEIGGELRYQWTSRRGAQEFHENLTASEFVARVIQLLGTKFGDLHWFADDADYTVRFKEKGECQIKRKPPTKRRAPATHNRARKYLIPDDRPCEFLQEIGVMLPEGRVKPSMFHKFRQINRYLEFVRDILGDLPAEGTLRVVDFGCGKSYLTFALHHYLTVICRREVDILGLDRKADVVQHCTEIAEKLKCRGLHFAAGEIQTSKPTGPVHLAISLHACDTATDDAIAQAIRWDARVIFAVPCCHRELASLLPANVLPGVNGYGLLKDRFCAMATDALRARFLETQGYRTQAIEFIDMEHTPKNVLLRAVRRPTTTETEQATRLRDYHQLRQELGIKGWHLDKKPEAYAVKDVSAVPVSGFPSSTDPFASPTTDAAPASPSPTEYGNKRTSTDIVLL